MILLKCCTQYINKSGRPSGHSIGKVQSSSQFPRRVVLKNVLITGKLHSSPMLVRSFLNAWMLGFSITWTKNFQMSKLRLEKAEEAEIRLSTFPGTQRKQGNSRKTSTSVSSTKLKPLTMWIITEWKALKEMGILDHLTCLLRNLYAGQEPTS